MCVYYNVYIYIFIYCNYCVCIYNYKCMYIYLWRFSHATDFRRVATSAMKSPNAGG